ncbi:hypothetical protein DPMN_030564, partial [Dreissena polymorpha]
MDVLGGFGLFRMGGGPDGEQSASCLALTGALDMISIVSQTMIELKDCAADAACAVPGESHCLGQCGLVS